MSLIEREQKRVLAFIKENKFPKYKDILKKLPVSEFAEYGEFNHTMIKRIYENLDNDKLIKVCYNLIRARGGEKAVRENFYTLCHNSPAAHQSNLVNGWIVATKYQAWDRP
tara:strand:+ start:3265 stop:3597 length:333 start_codon:yes stop_codon:yes gene_type:complete